MANQYTAQEVDINKAIELYESGLTQGEVGRELGVSQKVIYDRFKKVGYKSRIAKRRDQWGKNNHMWKGDEASYAAKHHWIEKKLGKPRKCEYCGKTEGFIEWANVGHTYKRNIKDWIRLCRKHHRQMDKGNSDILTSLRG